MNVAPIRPTLSHQKLRHPEYSAIGPAMIGPTWKVISVTFAGKGGEANHKRAEIECKVKRLIRSSFMQKHHISNDVRLNSLSRTSCNAIEHTCPHEATIRLSFGSPDGTAKADQEGRKIDGSPAEGCAQRDPIIDQNQRCERDTKIVKRTR